MASGRTRLTAASTGSKSPCGSPKKRIFGRSLKDSGTNTLSIETEDFFLTLDIKTIQYPSLQAQVFAAPSDWLLLSSSSNAH